MQLPDYNDLFEKYDSEREESLDKLPKCTCCGEPITDDFYYNIEGEILCYNCLNELYRKDVDDYE